MKRRIALAVIFWLAAEMPVLPAGEKTKPSSPRPTGKTISWKKTVVDRAFRSEGVAVADVNKDGKPDILAGDVWYQAPDWKMHVIRKGPQYLPKGYNPLNYSQTFAVFADDINGDGWPDTIVISYPGNPCAWYENPAGKERLWQEHIITHSACNETPQYADLFGSGKRVLVMGVQPRGQEHMGQMFWLQPGKDPAQPWEHHPISEPSRQGKEIPGTFKYSHGLGMGDVNGDGRNDVICTEGWWEQPAKVSRQPWPFHAASLGPACADMYACDIDGDGRNDILSSSAHQVGLWWHQQKEAKDAPAFVRHEMFPGSAIVADPKNYLLTAEEKKMLDLINQHRAAANLRPVRAVPLLCRFARDSARKETKVDLQKIVEVYAAKMGSQNFQSKGIFVPEILFKKWLQHKGVPELFAGNWQEIGVGFNKKKDGCNCSVVFGESNTPPKNIVVWEGMKKQLVSQTHALHLVDINGDGVKDLVTGRRFWAHGPHGDALPSEPAFLFWFEGRKGADGITTFAPHLIDDDSGVGTQFAVADINGDGIPDIIVANKKGVFVFEQVRSDSVNPPRKD